MNYQELIDLIKNTNDPSEIEQLYRNHINSSGFNDFQKKMVEEHYRASPAGTFGADND